MPTFKEWLKTQEKKDNPVGDFASDALGDPSAPSAHADKDEWIHYLHVYGAASEAIDACQDAWRLYNAYLKRHQEK